MLLLSCGQQLQPLLLEMKLPANVGGQHISLHVYIEVLTMPRPQVAVVILPLPAQSSGFQRMFKYVIETATAATAAGGLLVIYVQC